MSNNPDVSFEKVLCVAETKGDIEKYDLVGLIQALTTKFGSRGLEFKLRLESPPFGVADIVGVWYKGFVFLNTQGDDINDFVVEWGSSRGEVVVNENL